ncbi:MAG: elongation factor Ts [Magnetococcales bacterium]|nr:elongation factor Ts [Magnetococcales bacterium]
MSVTAQMVKDLREKTGAGMMECKKALTETGGDMQAAIDWLRKKGLSVAAKKSGRVAAEGKVVAVSSGNAGILLEVNLETDFASRNEHFGSFIENLSQLVLKARPADMDALQALPYGNGRSVAEEVTHLISVIGENMAVRRYQLMEVAQGVVGQYIHMNGKIGVLVGLESGGDAAALAELGKQLAMHVAAASPQFLDRSVVPVETLNRERDVLMEQAKASGKPENILAKMVEGRISKFYGEVCMLEQLYVVDQESKVSQVVEQAAKKLGSPIRVTGFARFQLGEGIQKEEKDFAAEVAQQMG